MKRDKKIVIIGLDGANKNTAGFMGLDLKNVHEMLSTIPPYTPPAWTSILTGVNPAKHGVMDFQKIDFKTFTPRLTTSHDVKYYRISELLNMHGLKSILINLPMTYPFDGIRFKKDNIIVSDWAAPRQEIYPQRLNEKYQEYLLDPPSSWRKAANLQEYAKVVEEYTTTRLDLYYDLLENYEWDLYFVVFSETDWLSHIFPQILEGKNVHIVNPIFQKIKEFIDRVMDIADITFITSDHGFEVKHKIFYVNEALARSGFIKYNHVKASLARFGGKILPKKIIKMFVKTGKTQISFSSDPQKRKAFMTSSPSWGVYLADKTIKEHVKKALKEFPEISNVLAPEEIYDGPHLDSLPDLFVIPEKGVKLSRHIKGKLTEPIYMGDHNLHGILASYGDGIRTSISFDSTPTVYDIAPTILHIFGLPIPNDMDGRVLIEIFEEDSEFANRELKYVSPSYYKRTNNEEKLKNVIKELKLKGKI
ncbi:alkaline phosphatase family protein [Thermococcus sp.]|uniref:alkaline phosphatase family protein n=1 Tax=Thermococcus sp. TaxID=35749 RepID=UPI00262B7B57|nr:alkaline phosphatase family protein [Thermococcus sp.]MCD6143415.1 alkaline phosphatase family protein [Thermococcus sp.]